MIYTTEFRYKPTIKTLNDFPDIDKGEVFHNTLVALIHSELIDEDDPKGVENKLLKNIKWAAKKNDTSSIVLHSFAHLAESKASPSFTKDIFDRVEERLLNAEYECSQTAFGYFMDLGIIAPGISQARIFKSI